jgi:inorganic pyrophosphatase
MKGMPYLKLPAFDEETKNLNVIIETPKGCRNKYAFDPDKGLFVMKKVLPAGSVFPFDFGFIPSTKGEDGDPLDILVLMDEPAFCGCLVLSRLVGVIEAEQKEKGKKKERNDRLIAVAEKQETNAKVDSLEDLPPHVLDEIEHFFVSYNAMAGKKFKVIGRRGPKAAKKLVEGQTEKKGK